MVCPFLEAHRYSAISFEITKVVLHAVTTAILTFVISDLFLPVASARDAIVKTLSLMNCPVVLLSYTHAADTYLF